MKLTYSDPVTAVFLRALAWERNVAKEKPAVNAALELYQLARTELGLPRVKGGRPQDFIQKLRPKYLTPAGTSPEPVEKEWHSEWRLAYLPSHHLVRELSDRPVILEIEPVAGISRFTISLRNAALSKLDVFIGSNLPPKDIEGRRGVYFQRREKGLYLGQSTEFFTRNRQHGVKNPAIWWMFASPTEERETLSLDTLNAAESLLISFWGEVCTVENANRGSDTKPSTRYLQEAILIVEAASASLLYLVREKFPDYSLPFKKPGIPGWPVCYMKPPRQSNEEAGE